MQQETSRPLMAALWMVGSVSCFSAMAVAARTLSSHHDVFEILGYRSLVGLIFVLTLALALGRLDRISARRLPGHILRNSVHFTGQALWVWAVTLIPLAQVFALEFTSPIWVLLLSPLLLGERLTRIKALAAAIGFVGVLLVAQPDFANPDTGVMAAAASAIFFAVTMILTKRLIRDEDLFSILFWLTLLQGTIAFALALRDGTMALPTAQSAPWLLVIGLCGVIAHLCLTKALSLAPASIVVPMDFVRLPLIALVGALLYDEPLTLGLAVGGALIVFGNLISIRAERRAAKAQHTPS